MIKCHLPILLAQKRKRVADLERELNINRSTLSAMYKEKTIRVDVNVIDKLCKYFQCTVCDILEYIPDEKTES